MAGVQDKYFFDVRRFMNDLFHVGDGHALLGVVWRPAKKSCQNRAINYTVHGHCDSISPSNPRLTIAGLANLFDGLFRAKRLA